MKLLITNLRPIGVIAKNTYREVIRERLLYGVWLAAALLTGASFFLATISLDQNTRVLQNTGLASIHILTVFIAVFVATNSMAHDVERRALYFLFPKPVSRPQYVLVSTLASSCSWQLPSLSLVGSSVWA